MVRGEDRLGEFPVFVNKCTSLGFHAEWLPWLAGHLADVPQDPGARRKWLATERPNKVAPEWKESLEKWYGPQAATIQHAEAFEITEYGRHPDEAEIRKLFPFFPAK